MVPWWLILLPLAAVAVLGCWAYLAAYRPTLSAELPQPKFPPAEAPTRKLQVLAKSCSSCTHFDLEEGQAVLANFPSFMRAAAAVPPSEMGRKVVRTFERDCRMCDGSKKNALGQDCPGCEGTGRVTDQEREPPGAPAKAKWDQFGACALKGELCWGGDIRPCHELRREQEVA